MAMDNGLSIGDALALTKNNDDNDGFLSGGAGGILALIIVFILLFGGGGAWGGYGNGAVGTYATQADIQRGFDTNQIINKLDVMTNVWKFTHSEILNRIDHIQYKVAKYKVM